VLIVSSTKRWGNREPKLQPILSHLHAALASRDSNEAISEDLFDMIGYDDMDMIVEILHKRSFVAAELETALKRPRGETPIGGRDAAPGKLSRPRFYIVSANKFAFLY